MRASTQVIHDYRWRPRSCSCFWNERASWVHVYGLSPPPGPTYYVLDMYTYYYSWVDTPPPFDRIFSVRFLWLATISDLSFSILICCSISPSPFVLLASHMGAIVIRSDRDQSIGNLLPPSSCVFYVPYRYNSTYLYGYRWIVIAR